MLFSGRGTDMSIKLHSRPRRALTWKIESLPATIQFLLIDLSVPC